MDPKPTRTIIAISGFAGAGKDTLGKAIAWHASGRGKECIHLKFADALKASINQALHSLGLPAVAFTEDREIKGKLRPVFIEFGEYCRDVDKQVFARIVADAAVNSGPGADVVIITDMRYANEHVALEMACAKAGHRYRPIYVRTLGIGPVGDTERRSIDELLKVATVESLLFDKGDLNTFDAEGKRIAESL